MARIPFVGRLYWREYLAVVGSLVFVVLETLLRVVTLALPRPIIQFFYDGSKTLFNLLSSSQGRRERAEKKNIVEHIAEASDFVDLCAIHGYSAEEHVVQTTDGYLLGLHRLASPRGEEEVRVNGGRGSVQKKIVYLHHGLLMNSEVWVCMTDRERTLPFMLVERGYDVWLGNNRGNKYSKKSSKHSPNSHAFWDFSIDEFAFHDIPDSIGYILETTGQPSLSYIGFSQGTAQAFATLSIHPALNDKVDVFIALAPAMSPAGLVNGIVDALVKASPQVLFLTFGRRSIFSSAIMWQQILYRPIFTRLIDMSLAFLFGWTGRNISTHQKLAAYPHLYSFTSTKSVVHWFQIIRNKSFQMYDDEVEAPLSFGSMNRYYKVAKFPTRNIKTPIVLLYGGSDSLVDIKVMLRELPRHTTAIEIKHFEHLDLLWADQVRELVFPHVFAALEEYAGDGVCGVTIQLPSHYLLEEQAQPVIELSVTDGYEQSDCESDSPYTSAAQMPPSEIKDRKVCGQDPVLLSAHRRLSHSPETSQMFLFGDEKSRIEHTNPSKTVGLRKTSGSSIGSQNLENAARKRLTGKGIRLGAAQATVEANARPATSSRVHEDG